MKQRQGRAWPHSQELWCHQGEGQRTGDRGQGQGQAPARQEGWQAASSAGWARMPGQVMRAGQVSSQAAPIFPSQGWMINALPGQAAEKKTLPCHEATGRAEWERSSASSTICCCKQRAPCPLFSDPPKAGPAPQCQQQLCSQGSTGWGLGHVFSMLVTQRRGQAPPRPALLSPLPPALASPEHGKGFFSIYTWRIIF